MEEWLPLVKKSPLFYGINDDELYTLLKCCASEQVLYEDGEYIFRMGESRIPPPSATTLTGSTGVLAQE